MDKKQPEAQQATCTNSDSWNCKYCNKTKTCAALAAGQATAAQAAAPANMRLCYSCGHPADAHPWVNDPRGGKRRGECPAAPAQPAAPQGVAEVNWWEADGDKYDASISPMQPAQGVAYADATYALRASRGQAPAGVLEDAARWHWMAEYIVGTRTDLDDEIIASATVDELRKLVDADLAARKQGEKQ